MFTSIKTNAILYEKRNVKNVDDTKKERVYTMSDNVYVTNVETKPKKSFSRSFKFLLGLGIFLSGFVSAGWGYFIITGMVQQIWREIGVCQYVRWGIHLICIVCCFVFMIKIAINERYFSKLLVQCIRIIGALITVSAFLLPRLSGYISSGFGIMQNGSFTLIDGNILTQGILLLIFAGIIKEGFSMQNELDEVL